MTPEHQLQVSKPEFVDNRDITLAEALNGHLDWLDAHYKSPVEVSIATGYFNAEGFALLADRFDRLSRVRLLLGAEPLPPPARPVRKPGDPGGAQLEAEFVRRGLDQNAQGLLRDRNFLAFDVATDRAVKRLLAFLKSERIEVRRYEKAFLHGKAYLFGTDLFGTEEGVIAGSSNFTYAGLTRNLELNLGRYDPTPVSKVREWFDWLWNEAVPYDLASVYQARFEPFAPYLIYLRVLWERYHQELEQEAGPGSRIRLTTFQNDGIFRARRILDQHNGVLIADTVGLGKTFVGGELIREITEMRRQRALLIAPAALRDGTWQRFSARYQLFLEAISYEQLVSDKQVGGDASHIKQPIREYELIVIDEAQAFRNPDTARARALRRLLAGSPPKKLVLMSATPVNNSIWDLYYLLGYFIQNDAAFSSMGIRSLKERFRKAAEQDPDDLRPDIVFDILDATTVRRTRSFVKKYYPNDVIIGPGGVEMTIQFPRPRLQSINYTLDDVLPGFFGEFTDALMPDDGHPKLTLARYAPSGFVKGGNETAEDAAMVGLIRSGLLKRFESSVYAFTRTLERLVHAHDVFMEGLAKGYVLTAEAIAEWSQVDSDESLETLIATSGSESARNYRVTELEATVRYDRGLLEAFLLKSSAIRSGDDPKLKALIKHGLKPILSRARREAQNESEFRRKRKVLIFTYYADSVDWIYDYLLECFDKDPVLRPYRDRLVGVTGEDSYKLVSREEAVFGFAPESSEAPPGMDADLFDVMVTTDVLAEGMNLQQCRNVINFDLPWNPMRLVQRHGRIDRIGSPHDEVFIWCYFPDRRLDQLLELESRIRQKVAQAAATVGVEHEVIPGAKTSDIVFAETAEEIERLRKEDPTLFETAGERSGVQSGEAYRQELRKALEQYGQAIEQLPWGAGSGMRGQRDGYLFCARVGERVFLRFVPSDGGAIVQDSLACLRLIACSPETTRVLDDGQREAAYAAWERARADILAEWRFATDPANLQPKIRPLLRRAAETVRKYPPRGLPQHEVDTLVEALEAPWGARIENAIRRVLEGVEREEASRRLADAVRQLGLQPYQAPEPLPPIDTDDILVVCWMALST